MHLSVLLGLLLVFAGLLAALLELLLLLFLALLLLQPAVLGSLGALLALLAAFLLRGAISVSRLIRGLTIGGLVILVLLSGELSLVDLRILNF